jgi:hypothetical protein
MTERPGYVRGRHYTEYVDAVKELVRDHDTEKAEALLLLLIDATERESRAEGLGVAPWYYETMANLYSRASRPEDEVAILERFAQQHHAPGVKPPRLLERLAKVRMDLSRTGTS